jgi:predicted alpha-1,6-mannanase (GH76 family)
VSRHYNRKVLKDTRPSESAPLPSGGGIFHFATWLLTALVLLTCSGVACAAQGQSQEPASTYSREAKAGIQTLQGWYRPASGLYAAPADWWNSANAITVLANYARVSGDDTWNPVLLNTFTAAQKTRRNFINDYFDDDSWWALAWIDAWDATRNPAYLSMAETIFRSLLANGWDTTTCGGGMWWSSAKKYKNAIANELFLSIAAELATRTQGKDAAFYREWAEREWQWFHASGMINPDHRINDGLDSTNPGACVNNGKNPWTYNQGVILGGLVALSQAEHDPGLLRQATEIADSAIDHGMTADGILEEMTVRGGDAPQFKGIFLRNLMELYHALPDSDSRRLRYREFAEGNARSIRTRDRGKDHQFGAVWQGPFDSADATRQALDALIAAVSMR